MRAQGPECLRQLRLGAQIAVLHGSPAKEGPSAALLPAVSVVRIASGVTHFVWTDQETVVQINGVCP